MSYFNAYPPAGGYSYPTGGYAYPQPPPFPSPAPVASYPGLPPMGPTPYSYSQSSYEACPSSSPYPYAPPPQSAAYQPYPVAPAPQYSNPSAHPVLAPTGAGTRKALLIGINYINNPNAHLEYVIDSLPLIKIFLQWMH